MTGEEEKYAVGAQGNRTESPSVETTDLQELEGPAAKRVAVGHAAALAGLTLQVVMQFAGKDEGIFIADVCSSWKESYNSTFKGCISTHRGSALMSIERFRWVWFQWRPSPKTHTYLNSHHSVYVGRYAPRPVIEAAISDETFAISSEGLMRGLAASGRVSLISELWDDHIPTERPALRDTLADMVEASSKYGYLHVLALIFSHLEKEKDEAACGRAAALAACRGGHVHLLDFLTLSDWWREGNAPTTLGGIAAANNRVEALSWLRTHWRPWDANLPFSAAVHGDVSTLQFLFENGCTFLYKGLISCCVQFGRLDALRWCHERGPELWTQANIREWLLLAGTYDKEEIATVLLEHGALWPDIGISFGVEMKCHEEGGHYSIVVSEVTCSWDVSFLEWAMSQGCTFGTWSSLTCARLMKDADWEDPSDCPVLETVAWAHSHGSPCSCVRHVPDF